MLTLTILLLLLLTQSSFQTTYLCNSNAACGCSTNPTPITKIVGGETAPINAWNWAVSLAINDTWLCAGSILSSSWILTAAHCVEHISPSDVLISAATNELFGFKQWRFASSVIVHQQYSRTTFRNDIALIKVSPPFDMTDSDISKICLPALITEDFPPINSTLIAIGWGTTSENGSISDTLQQVRLQRIPYESPTCYPLITNRLMQFCAGVPNGGKDSCQGDSGGPLMMFTSSQQWIIVGITSYGYGCARAEYSSIYTRISYYFDWIHSMNVTGAITADIVTTTTTSYFNINVTRMLTDNTSSSRNNSLTCYQHVYMSFIMILNYCLFRIFFN